MIRACLLLLALYAAPLWAQERILSFNSQVQVNADGSLDVTEEIRVRAEGSGIRRGIYRDFPTRYRDQYGSRVVVDFQMLDVLRDGKPEPWFTEQIGNGVRINTGNDDFLPAPGEFTFSLRYHTTRQLGFFSGHDELYWNVIGTGWVFPIESGSVEVRLPEPVPVEQLQAEAYTGPQGSRDQHYEASIPAPGIASWRLTRPLQPHEGLTIVLSFPKGVVAAPSRTQKLFWLLRDNRGLLIALTGLGLLLIYCVGRWRKIGRDPPAGTIIVRYDPPAGHSPAGLRYMKRMSYDMRCFSADLLSLAVGRGLIIQRDKKLLKEAWSLQRSAEGVSAAAHTPEQSALIGKLFGDGRTTLELDQKNAVTIQGIIQQHAKALKTRFKPRMFQTHGGSILVAFLIALLFSGAAFAIGAGAGPIVLLAIPVVLAMLAVVFTFAYVIKAPTAEGRQLMDEIEGLKRYLSVAEKQDLQRLQPPGTEASGAEPRLDAGRFESLLPYAVALDVEDAWTKKFTLAVGAAAAAAATSAITWYHGAHIGDIGSFSKAIGNSLAAQIASSSTPPGSSSGGGGGGSSGGGGGGGGGGGR